MINLINISFIQIAFIKIIDSVKITLSSKYKIIYLLRIICSHVFAEQGFFIIIICTCMA